MSRSRRKTHLFLVVSIPLLILTGVFFCLNPDRWYLWTTGFGKEKIQIEQSTDRLQEMSLEEMEQDERFTFDQSMMLINTEYMLTEDFVADTAIYRDSGVRMNTCILTAFGELSAAVTEECGEKLLISSGIRDRKRQAELYAQDPETATIPGASEHETGLCMDVYVPYFSGDSFLKAEAGRFVNSHCHEYGFIIRYPFHGEEITGIRFEPWHIRYVGQPHADIIYSNGLTLEEYINSLEEGICYETEGYFIIRQRPENGKFSVPADCDSYIVSPDNTGCYVITGQKKFGKILYLETI